MCHREIFYVDLPWTYLRYFSEFTLDFLCITLHFIIMAGNMSEGSDISGSDDSDNGNDFDMNVPNYPPPANYDSSSSDEDFVNFHPGWVQPEACAWVHRCTWQYGTSG